MSDSTSLELALELRAHLDRLEAEDAARGLRDWRLHAAKAILNRLLGKIREDRERLPQ